MNSAIAGTPGLPPRYRFLGDRNYSVWVNERGSGGSFSGDLLLTSLGDTRNQAPEGFLFFLRNLETGEFGILGQKTAKFDWKPGIVSIFQDLDGIQARLDICLVPGTAAEIRKVTLANKTGAPVRLDLTTFAEVVLNRKEAHLAHPGFSKLFLQTEFDESRQCLLVQRRPRDPKDIYPLLVHAFLGFGKVEYETARPGFLGRGRPLTRPVALTSPEPLSGAVGNVLDPVVSLRKTIQLLPDDQEELAFILGTASNRQEAADLVDMFKAPDAVTEIFRAAAAKADQGLAAAGISGDQEEYFQDMAGAVLFGHPAVFPRYDCLKKAKGQMGDLSRLGLSPLRDWVVIHAETPEGAGNLEQLIPAGRRWHDWNLPIQLVIVEGENGSEGESSRPPSPLTGADEAHVTRIDAADLTPGEFHLLNAAARLVVTDSLPDLSAGPNSADIADQPQPPSDRPAVEHSGDLSEKSPSPESLRFFNGFGGFNDRGDEYVIRLRREADGRLAYPPLPWVNVVANDQFGFLVSEAGAGCAWFRNSRENRLTRWSNDPVADPPGDAFYVRDEQTGAYWSCLPGPVPGDGDYEVRHGFGYSRFLHTGRGLGLDTTMFTAGSDPLRITRVSVTNHGRRRRKISLFGCAQLVLGEYPRQSSRFVTTWLDDQTGALLAKNPTSATCPLCVAFASVVTDPAAEQVHHSCSLAGFLGPEGDFSSPAALGHAVLDGRVESETESCFAHQVVLTLDPGQTAEVSFLLGQEADADWARELVVRHQGPAAVETAWREAVAFWREGLTGLQVKTPSPALDIMVNGWLPYQTLSCRIRGRTAFYQSGGAFGFRDQLQDASSLLPLWPEKTRQQILLHAAHQFFEGDVLHWWHPPHSRGIRTRFADDLLWLPLLTAEYIQSTGDLAVLEEWVPYLTARQLSPGEDEAFLRPEPSGDWSDLYEHCCRAIDRSLVTGSNGLPLFGTGDWNDGMNRVGREGRGESVWMGFFLVMVLEGFEPLCAGRGDGSRADRYAAHRQKLVDALNDTGWDGRWYRRGYYDDGSPLGSVQNEECRIDALAQAWSVLSKVAPPDRAEQALAALEENLVVEDPGLIKLLAPPFVDTPRDPGYIKGYVAGVRENGGQYTHAACWVVRALAKAGRRDKAARFLDLLNPILHTQTPEQVAVYQAEPYVVAADVYGVPPHVGRGGWTWYTGSSGWMYRVAVESILGLRTDRGNTLVVEPCIPDQWPGFEMIWKLPGGDTTYRIVVSNPDSCSASIVCALVDGHEVAAGPRALRIPLLTDGGSHRVDLTLGAEPKVGVRS